MALRVGKWVLACALVLAANVRSVRAEVVHSQVNANAANPQARVVRSPHLASCDPAASSQHRLVVFLNGTSAEATSAITFNDALASRGYHVISLDYPNGVTASSFRDSSDPLAFDHFRRAIVFGGPVNERHTVQRHDSIEGRLTDLLRFLASTAPDEGWRQYIAKPGVIWPRVVLAGHSQGAGHAAYLAQFHPVSKVLIIAGPQDYFTKLDRPAGWLSAASKTPRNRFRVLLHRQDEYNVEHQLAAVRALLGPQAKQPVSFAEQPPSTVPAPPILISERTVEGAKPAAPTPHPRSALVHASLMRPEYQPVWLYLLTR